MDKKKISKYLGVSLSRTHMLSLWAIEDVNDSDYAWDKLRVIFKTLASDTPVTTVGVAKQLCDAGYNSPTKIAVITMSASNGYVTYLPIGMYSSNGSTLSVVCSDGTVHDVIIVSNKSNYHLITEF